MGGLYPVLFYMSYFNTLLYIYQTLCKDFLLLFVLIAIIILHVSYELFRWFYNIFHLKECAPNCQCTTECADTFLRYVFCQKLE